MDLLDRMSSAVLFGSLKSREQSFDPILRLTISLEAFLTCNDLRKKQVPIRYLMTMLNLNHNVLRNDQDPWLHWFKDAR